MKNLENAQPGYRVHTVNDDHHLYGLETGGLEEVPDEEESEDEDFEENEK